MKQPYYDSILLIERLHRHFLEVLKVELDRQGVQDINNVQSLILYNIGEDELTVGELTARGYYLGSNVSYNVKKMHENGYLTQERSAHDRRSVRVRLSDKGIALRDKINTLFERQVGALGEAGLSADELNKANELMRKLERFWTSALDYTNYPASSAA
ncbi:MULTISPECIES: MarR family winged helix-turn-helix transcriptional regulator [Nitrospirillum]|uniref:DNA-binding MarR family transcriptional regulator n=1 Tax=Nitrospirillum amazonense TaxID=28077 RepID=A0A560GAG6_9PROT|nr:MULTISPECIES: MarR family winged helix-turn-helix transcriptional regulator [Nitrospirillum]MEA1650865.1 MarR family winged helix-turn-helix transcriptional regulator [Nitrospirillum sp. BR 11164]MEC4590710.1 MarR family winged helix-turn-helix transcriptional regulator [Nitrospirillum amazonense]TWB30886.1 DNA-binding MarR family transcriptional regulator [Nitrospirillum amazonense]